MSVPNQIMFKVKQLAEILIKAQEIHEGHWGVSVRFGLSAGNIGDASGEMFPSALIPITELGIQRFDEPNALTVDAAVVNPLAK